MPYTPRSTLSTAATGEAGEEASAVNPAGAANTASRWDIQQVCSRGVSRSSTPGSATVSSQRPNSPTSACSTRPPSSWTSSCIAVTDAEHRHPQLQQPRSSGGASWRVHRRGASREDHPARPARGDLRQRRAVGEQLGEDPALAHPPRDQLRVLAAVVDDHRLGSRGRGARALRPLPSMTAATAAPAALAAPSPRARRVRALDSGSGGRGLTH